MGLSYAFREALKGNFSNAFNGAFVSDDVLAAQDQAGDALSQHIQQQQADGLISQDQANQLYAGMSPNTDSDLYWSQSGSTPLQVFNQTLGDEASSIGGAGSSAINRVLGLGFKVIPWQVYVLALVLLMIWLYPMWKPFAATLARKR